MVITWEAGPFTLAYESGEIGMRLRSSASPNHVVEFGWAEIAGAGLVRAPNTAASDLALEQLTAPEWIAHLNRAGATSQTVILAVSHENSRVAKYIRIPRDGPAHDHIVADLQLHLEERWVEGEYPEFELRRKLDLASWWMAPVTCGFALVVALALLFVLTLAAGAEAVFEMLRTEWKIILVTVVVLAIAWYVRASRRVS